jgi:hypothetical protein
MNLCYISIEACVLLAVYLPVFVQMLLTNAECGVALLSLASELPFVCVCNSIDIPKCLRKCSEVDGRRSFKTSVCSLQIFS